jgi:hypothetical protein
VRRLRSAAALLLGTLFLFVLLEGLASTARVARRVADLWMPVERLYTRYDPELGWVSRPNLSVPDVFGRGVGLSTNARGFRGGRETAAAAGAARRIVCSGDSFTLGWGVKDEQSWCHLLSGYANDVETVNMGQGGYGIDQAFLWYRRDARELEHHLHLFAFIGSDVYRMQADSFLGFGKPYLALENGKLQVRNVPVPSLPYRAPRFFTALRRLDELRSVALLRGWFAAFSAPPGPRVERRALPELLDAVFGELAELNRKKGSELVIVYLPTLQDYTWSGRDRMRERLRGSLASRGLRFLDLTPELRGLAPSELDRLFLPGGKIGRHYSAEGHRFVAERMRERLEPWLTSGAGLPILGPSTPDPRPGS